MWQVEEWGWWEALAVEVAELHKIPIGMAEQVAALQRLHLVVLHY
jgi:hypothetical protein